MYLKPSEGYIFVSLWDKFYCIDWHLERRSKSLPPWASYQIRKIADCACAGNAGTVFPTRQLQRKTLVSGPSMHHGTCVTHVPWCMSGSLTCGGGENVPVIPGACAPIILCIWQEAHSEPVRACPGHPFRMFWGYELTSYQITIEIL